ncbi:MAG: hypothetical protein ACLQIQ_18045 [Beijerinckiaceae bacterium]
MLKQRGRAVAPVPSGRPPLRDAFLLGRFMADFGVGSHDVIERILTFERV